MQNKILVLALILGSIGVLTQSLFGMNESIVHFIFLIISVGVYYFILKLDRHALIKLAHAFSVFGVFLLLVLLFFADFTRGSKRWFYIFGFGIQPSVLFAPFFTFSLSIMLLKKPINRFIELIKYLLLILIPFFLIFKQPDLGTAIVLAASLGSIIYYSGTSLKFFVFLLIPVIPALLYLPKVLKPYQLQRLTSFLNPNFDLSGINYNSLQSEIAIGSGSFFGKGIISATQSKLSFLPEANTDFVFAALVESFGFVGGLIFVTIFTILFINIISSIRNNTDNKIYTYFTIGLLTYILVPFIFNIGMNLRVLPVVGVPLPLISAGGSTILSLFIFLGISHNLLKDS